MGTPKKARDCETRLFNFILSFLLNLAIFGVRGFTGNFGGYFRLVALPHGPLLSAAFLHDTLLSHPSQSCPSWLVRRRLRIKKAAENTMTKNTSQRCIVIAL
jgi:hypothetical protein